MNTFASPDRGRADAANATVGSATLVQRLMPSAALFFVAPMVAEFLLGNMSITHLRLLAILAPLYGGGAILIRESVRRTGRGWPCIFVLALAYGVLEEAFLMQSLFNPNFLGQNLHLLDPAYLPALGIGVWYTIFVLTLHTVWSISVPIALVESLVPKRADSPWLGPVGFAIVAVAFALACIAIASSTIRRDPIHFIASHAQFTGSAVIFLVLIAAALCLPRRADVKTVGVVPNPWALGIGSFALATTFLVIPLSWSWWAVLAYLALDITAVLLVLRWSHRTGWRAIHKLSLAGGAATAYAIHAFIETPSVGHSGVITRIGNLVFAFLAASLLVVGARRVRNLSSTEFFKAQRS
jgi:hypothetical protein